MERVRPMLYGTARDLDTLLTDDDWYISQKFDGKRLLLVTQESGVTAIGRDEQEVPVPDWLAAAAAPIKPNWVFDGEMVDSTYRIFDILRLPEGSVRRWHWLKRQELLATILKDYPDSRIMRVKQYTGFPKEDFFEDCEEQGVEGVVFSLATGFYTGGRSFHKLKHKFVKEIDCHVGKTGRDGKDNADLELWDEAQEKFVSVGTVTTLNGDGDKIKPGMVVTVRFLYVTEGNRLYQPTLPRIREDKPPRECMVEQLDDFKTRKEEVNGRQEEV